MSLFSGARDKIVEQGAYWLAGRWAVDAERGKFGPKWQALYVKTKGKKTAIGAGLLLILGALDYFAPPWADQTLFVSKLVVGTLAAIGFIEKSFRSEPVFEPWMLEAFARVFKVVGTAQGVVALAMPFVPQFFPGSVVVETWAGNVQLVTEALAAACLFVNRVAVANKDVPPKPASVTEDQPALP
jgi:hypothetical protein